MNFHHYHTVVKVLPSLALFFHLAPCFRLAGVGETASDHFTPTPLSISVEYRSNVGRISVESRSHLGRISVPSSSIIIHHHKSSYIIIIIIIINHHTSSYIIIHHHKSPSSSSSVTTVAILAQVYLRSSYCQCLYLQSNFNISMGPNFRRRRCLILRRRIYCTRH